MREVYTSRDVTQVGFYKSILDEAGISSFIRNEYGNNPEMAGATFAPCLCVIRDGDYDLAIGVLKARQGARSEVEVDWVCGRCAESNPGNFEICWNCGAERPGG